MKPLLCIRSFKFLTCSLLFVLLLSVHSFSYGQGPFVWQNNFSRPGVSATGPYVESTDITYTENGSAIVAGATLDLLGASTGETDACILKYSSSGVLMNTFYFDYNSTHGFDKVVKIVAKGNYLYALIKGHFNVAPTYDYDIQLFKMDTNLTVISSNYFNGTGNVNDIPVDMGIDMYGNVYVVGNTSRTATGGDILLLKYDPNLVSMFVKYFSSTGVANDVATAMKVEPTGVCDITGSAYSSTLGNRLLAMKYWGNGISLWTRYHDANLSAAADDIGTSISYDPSTGDVFVTGKGYYGTNYDWVVAKFNGIDGTKAWSKRFSGLNNNDDAGMDISYYSSSALYVVGNFKSTSAGVSLPSVVLKKLLPSDGSSVWSKTYTGITATPNASSSGAYASSLFVTPNENVYVLGTTYIQTPTYNEANHLVLKYSSAGVLNWSDLRNASSFSGFQSFKAVKATYIPSSQTLYVAGTMNVTMSFIGSMTITKYAPTSILPPSNLESRSNLENSNIDFNLYPNPCSNNINVNSMGLNEFTSIKIVDINGKVVYVSGKSTLPINIPTDQLSNGLYHLILNYNGSLVTKKFLKE